MPGYKYVRNDRPYSTYARCVLHDGVTMASHPWSASLAALLSHERLRRTTKGVPDLLSFFSCRAGE
jgi:hypothetical protein